VGVLLAFFVEWFMTNGGTRADGGGFVARVRRFWTPVRVLGVGALVVALLPIAPTPLTVSAREPAPRFFSTGAWRDRVPEGGTVGLLPFGWSNDVNGLQWQAEQDLPFKILSGYFLGPDPARDDRRARFGAGGYYVRTVLSEGRRSSPALSDRDREYCLAQLRSWRTDVLLLPDDAPNAAAVREGAEQILGPGQHVEDVWIWHVRAA
jgi:hypothetical protein